MKYTELGNTGIKVSRICAGCMSYGVPSEDFLQWTLDYEKSREIEAPPEFGRGFNFSALLVIERPLQEVFRRHSVRHTTCTNAGNLYPGIPQFRVFHFQLLY